MCARRRPGCMFARRVPHACLSQAPSPAVAYPFKRAHKDFCFQEPPGTGTRNPMRSCPPSLMRPVGMCTPIILCSVPRSRKHVMWLQLQHQAARGNAILDRDIGSAQGPSCAPLTPHTPLGKHVGAHGPHASPGSHSAHKLTSAPTVLRAASGCTGES